MPSRPISSRPSPICCGYYVEPPASALPEPVEGSAETRGSQPPPFPEREPFGREGQPVEGGLSPMLQWFLLTLYHGLGQHLPLPIDLPWNLRQTLRPQLTPLQQADAEGAAQQLLARFQSALTGYLQLPAWTLPSVIDATPIIEQALATGDDLEIRYRGPTANQVTTRTITPYWLETRHQTRYLIGWCHLRQQERTFRLDRIEAIQLQPRA